MKQTVNLHDFRNAFKDYNREDNFSHEGLEFLFDQLCQLEKSSGEETELDVIAICCDFTESTLEEIQLDYTISIEKDEDLYDTVIEYLQDNTFVLGVIDDTVIYQNF